jgi:16S rRNA processing protein RimM
LISGFVTIGRVVKPQGRKGEVLAESLSDRPDRFPSLTRAFLSGPSCPDREIRVTSCWPHKGRFVLKFEGVDSIDEAERYRGAEIRVDGVPELPEGSYYHHELVGLKAVDGKGRDLGSVTDLLETGGEAKVLVVRQGGAELLYPLAAPFVKRVDLAGKLLVLEPQEIVDAD